MCGNETKVYAAYSSISEGIQHTSLGKISFILCRNRNAYSSTVLIVDERTTNLYSGCLLNDVRCTRSKYS